MFDWSDVQNAEFEAARRDPVNGGALAVVILTQPETDMLKGLAKAFAYYKAPAKTFAVLHPLKAVKWGGIFLLVGMAIKRTARRGEATRTG